MGRPAEEVKALDTQVGGNHYKSMPIQPVEFIQKNDLGFIEGNIVKYICRWRSKGGIDDVRKVIHYAELLIDFELNKESCVIFSLPNKSAGLTGYSPVK